MIVPVVFDYDGEAMVPQSRFRLLCDKQFVVGESYRLAPEEERTRATHNHFFASLHQSWLNLPEELVAEYPTETRLRKRALIATGYCDVRTFVCSSKEEALRLAAWLDPDDDDEIVDVRDCTVRIYKAKSQSKRAMGKAMFQESKTKVLDWVAALIEVRADQLGSAA